MSGSKRCCCGNVEGCLRCTTPTSFLGVPPYSQWCDFVYGFTFGVAQDSLGSVLLPEIKSNYTFTDYAIRVNTNTDGYCECDPDITFNYLSYNGSTLYYDVNLVVDNNGNVINANNIGCTYDNRNIFSYDLESRNILFDINYIGMINDQCPIYDSTGYLCGLGQLPTDIEGFYGIGYGITQHNDAGFSCRFRACGFYTNPNNPTIPIKWNLPPGWCDPHDGVVNCQQGLDRFLIGVTFNHMDSYVIKSIQYAPVIRTIANTTPTPTPNCFYEIVDPNIPGSTNRPSPVLRSCYAPSPEEECRCQSGLLIYVKGRAEQSINSILYEEEQIVGPGLELIGNRNFLATGITFGSYSGPIGSVECYLYYYGCIDDAIYGIASPRERVFVLDSGVFIYNGVYETGLASPPSPPICFGPINPPPPFTKSECNYTNFSFDDLEEFDTCPYRTHVCVSGPFGQKNLLPASFFINLGIPQQVIVTRLN